ncbi:glycosyltransferase family 4 protein [Halomonas halmophila]|uniref:Glycosyl transferase n=1 Tax=Halomonas halmophila TaxID=252 RepID=A0A4Y4F331_9GAMM|nr:glycosyltransferase family 4 protein [Halomonas halmophila]GED23757.1 glycosyl transferase [Halomonas halmophila]
MNRATAPSLAFMVPGALRQATGGYRYDARLVDGLRERGWRVEVHELAGRFPEGDDQARRSLGEALAALPDATPLVIDGLALGNLGEVAQAHAERLDITALVHHPLGDEAGLDAATRRRLLAREAAILNRVARIVVTSPFTARRLVELGVDDTPITVVEPGVEAAAPAEAAWPAEAAVAPCLLCVATLTPRKGHLLMLDALATLQHRDWQLDCVGDEQRDPEHAEAIRQRIEALALQDRVRLRGSYDEAALAEAYHQSDLVLVPSWYEGYGMVVTEALARGLPLVSTLGGALRDTVPAAASWRVEPGDSAAFAVAIEQWWSAEARDARRQAAVKVREALTGWEGVVTRFVEALMPVPPGLGERDE